MVLPFLHTAAPCQPSLFTPPEKTMFLRRQQGQEVEKLGPSERETS